MAIWQYSSQKRMVLADLADVLTVLLQWGLGGGAMLASCAVQCFRMRLRAW